MPKTTTGQEKLALVKRRKPAKDAESVLEAVGAIHPVTQRLSANGKVLVQAEKSWASLSFPPPAGTVAVERIRMLATVRRLAADSRRALQSEMTLLASLLAKLDALDLAIEREQAEIDAEITAGAEIEGPL